MSAPSSPAAPSTRHPVAVFSHVGFKLAAVVAYVTCEWFETHFVLNFVTCVLLLAGDFWVTKNVSGRLLVGLRYWNEIDTAGVSTWRFESRSAEGMKLVDARESTLFWYSLYLSPVAWIALAAIALARLNLEYFLICAVAVVLGAANVLGYTKCSKDAQTNISNFARTSLINSVLHRFV